MISETNVINEEKAKIKMFNFNGNHLEFKNNSKKIDRNILGVLFLSPLGPYEAFNSFNIKDLFTDYSSGLQIEPFNIDHYLIGYINKSGILSLKIIDRNKEVLKTTLTKI